MFYLAFLFPNYSAVFITQFQSFLTFVAFYTVMLLQYLGILGTERSAPLFFPSIPSCMFLLPWLPPHFIYPDFSTKNCSYIFIAEFSAFQTKIRTGLLTSLTQSWCLTSVFGLITALRFSHFSLCLFVFSFITSLIFFSLFLLYLYNNFVSYGNFPKTHKQS